MLNKSSPTQISWNDSMIVLWVSTMNCYWNLSWCNLSKYMTIIPHWFMKSGHIYFFPCSSISDIRVGLLSFSAKKDNLTSPRAISKRSRSHGWAGVDQKPRALYLTVNVGTVRFETHLCRSAGPGWPVRRAFRPLFWRVGPAAFHRGSCRHFRKHTKTPDNCSKRIG